MERGFTLLELLITLVAATVLAAVTVPPFSRLIERHRTMAVVHEATGALALARLEAVRRGRPVALCPTIDGKSCRDDLRWDSGWLLFVDADRSGQPERNGEVIREFEPLRHHRMASTRGRPLVRFSPNGWSAGSNVTLSLCDRQGLAAQVIVNNAGRARSERPARVRPCPFES
ncbi:GspH/FimT family pseudopilin [Lysobacter humi (ex Lee et al. 2017)]